jgi:hypothetical protein
MRTRPDGDHGGLIVRGYLFIYLRPTEPVIRTRDSSGATMSQMVGARGQVTRGGPRASSGQEAGAAGARDSPRATLSQETEVVVLMLVCRDTRYIVLMLVRRDTQYQQREFPADPRPDALARVSRGERGGVIRMSSSWEEENKTERARNRDLN